MMTRVLAAVLIVVATAPAVAQRNNASDVTGVSVTGSALVAGNFVAVGTPRPVQLTTELGTPFTADRIRALGTTVENQLTAGTFTDADGLALPPDVQIIVLGVLKSRVTGAGLSANALRELLAEGAPGHVDAAVALVDALIAMGTTPTVPAVATAVRAFNVYVGVARPEFLATPPAEFRAVHAVIMLYAGAVTEARPAVR